MEYKDQKQLCGELLGSNGKITSGEEIQKLQKSYQKMADIGFRLREQLPSLEAEEITMQIDIEDNEVFEVKKRFVRQMIRMDDDTDKDQDWPSHTKKRRHGEEERPSKEK